MTFGLIIFIYDWYFIIHNNEFGLLNNLERCKLVVPTMVIILYIIAFCKYRFAKKNNAD